MVDLWAVPAQMCEMFCCGSLHIKKALGIFRELISTTRTTARVAFWDPPSESKNVIAVCLFRLTGSRTA